jgi:hypothetical protein
MSYRHQAVSGKLPGPPRLRQHVSAALAMPGPASLTMRALAATLLSAAVLAITATAAQIGDACVDALNWLREEPNTHCGGQFACVNNRCAPLLELGERCKTECASTR